MACRVLVTSFLSGFPWDLTVENRKLVFKQVSYPLFFVPQRNDVCAEPQKPTKILANIQVFNNAIKTFRMPKGCVCVHWQYTKSKH